MRLSSTFRQDKYNWKTIKDQRGEKKNKGKKKKKKRRKGKIEKNQKEKNILENHIVVNQKHYLWGKTKSLKQGGGGYWWVL